MLRDNLGRFIKGNKGFWLGKKRENVSGKKNYKWVGEKNNHICILCNKKFRLTGDRKYCSYKCYWKSKKGIWTGSNNPRWRGGTTTENSKIRNSEKYKLWRMNVLKRDRFSCVICGYRSRQSLAHGDKKCDIRVDHIKPFSLYPKLRFELNNGRTLCIPCDRKHGWNYNRKKSSLVLQESSETICQTSS